LNHILRSAERQYYQSQLENAQNNLRQSWKIIKEVINKNKKMQKKSRFLINGNIIENTSEIAEAFNNFFINIGNELDKKIPKTLTKPTAFIPRNYNINLFLDPATSDEIGIIIDKLKECATGWDCIPSIVIKDSKEILKPTLRHIINNSLTYGIFPTELKLANVVPIFKAGSTEEITNYRPVSLLTTFSKIYEKIFYNRLLKFLK
jgi:hypothetical protein